MVIDVCIIGSGPSGLFAAFQCGMLGLSCVVLETLNMVGGQCSHLYPQKNIYDIPGIKEISAQNLINSLVEQATQFVDKVSIITSYTATEIKKENEYFHIRSHNRDDLIISKTVIIASGMGSFEHKKIPIKNASKFEGKSLFYSVTDKKMFSHKSVIIIGGGDSAVDWANDLSYLCSDITLVHRREDFTGANSNVQKLHQKSNVNILKPYTLLSIDESDNIMQGASFTNISTHEKVAIKADYILAFFGLSNSIGAIKSYGIELDENNKIKIDNITYETSINGIYAIGDCAKSVKICKLIATSFDDAVQAVHQIYYKLNPSAGRLDYSTTLLGK